MKHGAPAQVQRELDLVVSLANRMKLTAEEMELARGGLWVTVGLIACAVAGGVVGYFSRP